MSASPSLQPSTSLNLITRTENPRGAPTTTKSNLPTNVGAPAALELTEYPTATKSIFPTDVPGKPMSLEPTRFPAPTLECRRPWSRPNITPPQRTALPPPTYQECRCPWSQLNSPLQPRATSPQMDWESQHPWSRLNAPPQRRVFLPPSYTNCPSQDIY
jgi:hypothetical protein